jgi:hypothetical protein
MELPLETQLTTGHRFCGMELFLRLSRHFTAMSTVALLLAIFGVTSLLLHATKMF